MTSLNSRSVSASTTRMEAHRVVAVATTAATVLDYRVLEPLFSSIIESWNLCFLLEPLFSQGKCQWDGEVYQDLRLRSRLWS